MNLEPEFRSLSIVALGGFNPRIFHPQWFAANNLIAKEEAEKADVAIINNEVAIFGIDWFELHVDHGRLALKTHDIKKAIFLQQLALGAFRILEHTPVSSIGLNSDQDLAADSEETWHAVDHKFAPKELWSGCLTQPGLISMTVQGKRDACSATYAKVRLEPSRRVKFGVFIAINQHYEISADGSQLDRNERVLRILNNDWSSFMDFSRETWKHLLGQSALQNTGN